MVVLSTREFRSCHDFGALASPEKTIAPYRIFFQNSNTRDFETLEPLPSNRPSSKRGRGGLGRKRQISKIPARRKKKRWCPSRPGQGLGCGPGGTIVRERPLLRVVDQEGGGTIFRLGSSFSVPNFCISDNLAAERIREKVLLTLWSPAPGVKE